MKGRGTCVQNADSHGRIDDMAVGRPLKEFSKKEFENLVGIGCTQEEICWWFRDDTGKSANIDTLSRWCKRTYGLNFQEYFKKYGGIAMKISLRKNQLKLAEKSAAMAIFLGKNWLGQTDRIEQEITSTTNEGNQVIAYVPKDGREENGGH